MMLGTVQQGAEWNGAADRAPQAIVDDICAMLQRLAATVQAVTTKLVAVSMSAPPKLLSQDAFARVRAQILGEKGTEVQQLVTACGGIGGLAAQLQGGSAGAQEQAAWALFNLAIGSEDRKAQIAAAGAVPPLVALRAAGSQNAKVALTNLGE
jgi:hypothetical protein